MLSALLIGLLAPPPVSHESRTIPVSNKRIKAEVVRVRLGDVRVRVGLAGGRIGRTEPLAALAARHNALAAINGSFFEAYEDRAVKNPHHTVITGGQVVHIGNVGSLIGFRGDGTAHIGRLELGIVGAREGSEAYPYRWFAYWLNRYPTAATVTIYTPHWGNSTDIPGGRQAVVENGVVTDIGPGPKRIPRNGFVLFQEGVRDSAFTRIVVGSRLSYRVVGKGSRDEGLGAFAEVKEAVGAGPRLLSEGRVALDPSTEGFSSEKILSGGGARSLAGLTAQGELLLVASSGTMAEMAQLMKALGCRDAMNLDGGASSGLIFQGKALRTPGRAISNALLVLPK